MSNCCQSFGKKWRGKCRNTIYRAVFAYKEKDILTILFQIGSACSNLQQNGYVHRNISPSNILLFKGKKYKLSNFTQIRKYNDLHGLEKKDTYFSDPYINSILSIKNPTAKDFKHIDLIKSDVFILGLILKVAEV